MAGADQFAINRNCELVATKDASRPWTLWVWDILLSEPLAVVNFRDRIKQILWHPTDPEVLLILTVQKEPIIYVWDASQQRILIAEHTIVSGDAETAVYECKWLQGHVKESPLLFVGSPHSYDAGIVDFLEQGGVVFESVLHGMTMGGD